MPAIFFFFRSPHKLIRAPVAVIYNASLIKNLCILATSPPRGRLSHVPASFWGEILHSPLNPHLQPSDSHRQQPWLYPPACCKTCIHFTLDLVQHCVLPKDPPPPSHIPGTWPILVKRTRGRKQRKADMETINSGTNNPVGGLCRGLLLLYSTQYRT